MVARCGLMLQVGLYAANLKEKLSLRLKRLERCLKKVPKESPRAQINKDKVSWTCTYDKRVGSDPSSYFTSIMRLSNYYPVTMYACKYDIFAKFMESIVLRN